MSIEQHLSALDSTFLELEDADASAHMHIGGVMVFEGAAPSRADLLERLHERLPALPRFHQRLRTSGARALHRPEWETTPDFVADDHVVAAALPAPASDEQLLEWAGEFYSQRLDRRRPLWQAVVIGGLEGDRWALASKLHHCLADGVGSLEALRLWIDGADAIPAQAPPGSPEPSPLDFVRAGFQMARHPVRTLEQSVALADVAVREELHGAPRSSLNDPIGALRRVTATDADLAAMKEVKETLGGKVNDVALAAVTSGLRALLLARGEELPEEGLRAMVPVNVRPGDAGAAMGNRILSLFVSLPVAEPDPFERYDRIRRQSAAAKQGRQPAGTDALLRVGEWLPPALHVPFAQSLFGVRLFNVTVTNIPGPPVELRAFGSRLVRAIPIVPLAAEHAVGIAILSYGGRVTFAVNADRDTVRDVDVLTDGIREGLGELRQTT